MINFIKILTYLSIKLQLKDAAFLRKFFFKIEDP
jgi:hypothetical protein